MRGLSLVLAAALLSVAGAAHAAQSAKPLANEFATEAEAQGHCPGDTIVWVSGGHKVYHLAGDRYYGKTKHGGYMCLKDAEADHLRAAKMKKPKT